MEATFCMLFHSYFSRVFNIIELVATYEYADNVVEVNVVVYFPQDGRGGGWLRGLQKFLLSFLAVF